MPCKRRVWKESQWPLQVNKQANLEWFSKLLQKVITQYSKYFDGGKISYKSNNSIIVFGDEYTLQEKMSIVAKDMM